MARFHRFVCVPVVLIGAAGALAQTAAPQAPVSGPGASAAAATLKVGDKAPALQIEHWVKGAKVEKFESGKAYIVEFWATWCGPCIQNIPHLTQLQKTYKDKGLTVIGVSSADRAGIEDVRPFVEKNGERMGYTIAVDDASKTSAAYMGATRQQGIPCAYVVDKAGRLAWYGHPQQGMDEVVKRVVNGTFDGAAFARDMDIQRDRSARFEGAVAKKDWAGAEAVLTEIEKADPSQKSALERTRFILLYQFQGDKKAAASLGERLLTSEFKDDPEALMGMAAYIAGDPAPPKDAQALGVRMAERAVEIEAADPAAALTILADMHRLAGDLDKAVAVQTRALAACADEAMRKAHTDKLVFLKAEAASKTTSPPPVKPAP